MNPSTKDVIQDCNLNFLIGSGLSSPYLKTLGQIEELLTRVDLTALQENEKQIIKCSLYKSYFDGVMFKNCSLLDGDNEAQPILGHYRAFLNSLYGILRQRKSTILGKEVNLFTTNIDVFLEKAIEQTGFECNDGFSGRFSPRFSLSNFRKSHFKRSLQFDNQSELPTVNLLKLHGSLTWRVGGEDAIGFSRDLAVVKGLRERNITPSLLLDVGDSSTFEDLATEAIGKEPDASVNDFLAAYNDLLIVNPTKDKFRRTLLDETHYELLRIYSNELEKENTVLFVLGFSFADEHIRQITLRAANSNPTLIIRVIAYDSASAAAVRQRFPSQGVRNGNISIVGPPLDGEGRDCFKYDFPTINEKIFFGCVESARGASGHASQGKEEE